MNTQEERRMAKICRQCEALARVIIAVRGVYGGSDAAQKALIETMIGAAIWYVPKPIDAWTGFISEGALRVFHPDSGVEKPKFSEEHVYPRKVAARLLLADESLGPATMTKVFCEKYGRLHYITPESNTKVRPFQRAEVFTTPEEVYEKAGVVLIEVDKADLRSIIRRHRQVIERYVPTSGSPHV